MRFRSALRRRPSAPMVVSVVALFMSLGGVGYAAAALPANSVGTAQLQDNSVTYTKIVPDSVGRVRLADRGVTTSKIRNENVTYKKIAPRSIGRVRADLNQLQARLASTCAAGTAIGGVDATGKVTCNPTAPARVAAADKTATVTATAQDVNTVTLPAGSSYLVFANPEVTATGGTATVTCSLTVGSATQSRSATVDAGAKQSIALQLATAAGAAAVSCTTAGGTGVSVTTAINAIQTAS